MIRASILCLSLITGFALSIPSGDRRVLHERRDVTHPRWMKGERLHPDSVLPIRIGLTQSNLHAAEDFLMEVSHPESKSYGKHWTSDQVTEAFKPSIETVEAVRQWLIDHGIPSRQISQSRNKQWLAFDATRNEAEHLMQTEFHEYTDSHTGNIQVACEAYSLPTFVKPHIDYITPGIRLLAPSPSASEKLNKRGLLRQTKVTVELGTTHGLNAANAKSGDLDNCDELITPACIRALYNIPERKTRPQKSNSMGIFQSENQFYYQADLDSFFSQYAPNIPNGTHPIPVSINGALAGSAPNASAAGEEANLDFQLSYPIVYPQTVTLFSVDDYHYGTQANETYKYGFNTFLDAIDGSYCEFAAYGEKGDSSIDPVYPDPDPEGYKGTRQCGTAKITNVVSFSYGGQEAFLPISYQKRQCLEYLKLGLQGVTFLFASGDAGVGDYPYPYGLTSETGCLGPEQNIFNPTWPDNCPWVTAVGATKVYPGHSVTGPDPESAVYDPAGHPFSVNYSSGGGFSNVYNPASYQRAALDSYFDNHKPSYPSYAGFTDNSSAIGYSGPSKKQGGLYNRLGRGIPDVAAVGDNAAIYSNGKFTGHGAGTSASTPIFASIINRINDERIAVGKRPVGFINPVLYKHPEVFRDIVNGSNPGCGTTGFDAVKGWDPVTGLGTSDYPKMLELFMSLP